MFLPSQQLKVTNNKGFTLIELMVVVSIIAILSVVGVTVYSGIQTKAQDSKRRADIDAISNAFEAHYNSTTGKYPAGVAAWFSSNDVPKDPVSGSLYGGWPGTADSATYSVCANLSGGASTPSCTATSTTCYCKQQQQ